MVQGLGFKVQGKKLAVVIAISLIWLILPHASQAATYYCDPNGNNSNDGLTPATAWGTLESVAAAGKFNGTIIKSGDTVKLHTGFHGGFGTGYNPSHFVAKNTDYITIEADTGAVADINFLRFTNCAYWRFKGLRISPSFSGEATPEGRANAPQQSIIYAHTCDHIIIEDCNIFTVDNSSAWTALEWNVISYIGIWAPYSNYWTVHRNFIHNIQSGMKIYGTASSPATNNLIEQNVVDGFCDNGIVIGDSPYCIVQDNRILNTYSPNNTGMHADMLQIISHAVSSNYDITIRRNYMNARTDPNRDPNTIGNNPSNTPQGLFCDPYGIIDSTIEDNVIMSGNAMWGIALAGGCDNLKIVNNTVLRPYNVGSWPDITVASGTNVIVRNNIADNFPSGAGITADHNFDISDYDPNVEFVDYYNGNVHLAAGSHFVDAGSSLDAPAEDLDRNSRPQGQGYDVGAYESTPIYYVRSDATGAGDGSDWTNAYTKLPDKLERGSTYYIADGNYPGYDFDDPEDGEKYIYIKKAIESDHGTGVGWQASYGDGVARFVMNEPKPKVSAYYGEMLLFSKGYYILDGQVGGGPGSWDSGHGFEAIVENKNTSDYRGLLSFGYEGNYPSNIQIKHMKLSNPQRGQWDWDYAICAGQEGVDLTQGLSNITISYCYVDDMYRPFHTSGASNWIVEYNYFKRCHGFSPEQWYQATAWHDFGSDYMMVRYNLFEDMFGTAWIEFKKTISGTEVFNNYGWEIYGNIFYYTPGYSGPGVGGNGIIGDAGSGGGYPGATSEMKIYNNVFANLYGENAGIFFYAPESANNKVYNNIWYNCNSHAQYDWFTGVEDHNYNWFYGNIRENQNFDSTLVASETNAQLGTVDPFVDWQAKDFSLKSATDAGKSDLGAPYNKDMFSNERGADGVWDRGAVEYISSTFLYGDVSGDADISAYDAALTAQAAVGLITLTTEQFTAADVDGSKDIRAYDAALIAQKAVGLIDKFPVEG
jgi:hypothetical protein